jgi:hypothetical protein
MFEDDPTEAALHASATNILQCLTMLAEEADKLGLPRTFMALRKALRACQSELSRPLAVPRPRPRRHLVLH